MVSIFTMLRIRTCVFLRNMIPFHRGDFMQDKQAFYRCLAADASSRALWKIREILADDTLEDPE